MLLSTLISTTHLRAFHQPYAQPKTSRLAVCVEKSYPLSPNLTNTASQAAGIVSKVFEHPFDLTKVRLQAQVLDATARFRGPLDCLVLTFRNEGMRGLYRVCLRFFSPLGDAHPSRHSLFNRVYPPR